MHDIEAPCTELFGVVVPDLIKAQAFPEAERNLTQLAPWNGWHLKQSRNNLRRIEGPFQITAENRGEMHVP